MTNPKSFLLIIFCVLLFSGCSSVRGPKIDSSTLYKIKVGETTKQDVVTLLGKPMDIEHTENNEESYLYEKVLTKANVPVYCTVGEIFLIGFFIPECYKDHLTNEVTRLNIIFDEADIVKKRSLDELLFHGEYFQSATEAKVHAQKAAAASMNAQRQQQNDSYHRNQNDLQHRYDNSGYGRYGH